MVASHPSDALFLGHERARRLRAETAARRHHRVSATSRALAAALRCAAERLDPAPLAKLGAAR